MTVERFYETLESLISLDSKLQFQELLESVSAALGNITAAPAQPTHQSTLATVIASLDEKSTLLSELLTPAQIEAISEIGGEEFFDPEISESIRNSISANPMTPSVARDFVSDLVSRRATFLSTVKQTLAGMKELGISSDKLATGSADLAFLIPRSLFKDELGSFAKELNYMHRLFMHLSESVTGKAEDARLETLASSTPTVALVASAPIIAVLAHAVNKFLEAWERVEKIRNVRAETKALGVGAKAVEELSKQITETVDRAIKESIEMILKENKSEHSRRNELENALRQDIRRLFGQIERGLVVQFRAVPNETANDTDKKALETISALSRSMIFPAVADSPLLLSDNEVLESDTNEAKAEKNKDGSTTKRTKKAPANQPI